MNKYEATIKALELTDRLLNDDGLSYDIACELLRQRMQLIEQLKDSEVK